MILALHIRQSAVPEAVHVVEYLVLQGYLLHGTFCEDFFQQLIGASVEEIAAGASFPCAPVPLCPCPWFLIFYWPAAGFSLFFDIRIQSNDNRLSIYYRRSRLVAVA
jgi:hypothetical protein